MGGATEDRFRRDSRPVDNSRRPTPDRTMLDTMSDDDETGVDAFASIGWPRCPACMLLCEPLGRAGAWRCPQCGVIVI